MTWTDHANCKGVDVDLFFHGDLNPNVNRELQEEAKRFCLGCPVRETCLIYAVDNGEVYGIWGGLTTKERIRWARDHGRTPHGTRDGYDRCGCRCRLCRESKGRYEEDLQPCGTFAAIRRHFRRGEPLCGPCRRIKREAA